LNLDFGISPKCQGQMNSFVATTAPSFEGRVITPRLALDRAYANPASVSQRGGLISISLLVGSSRFISISMVSLSLRCHPDTFGTALSTLGVSALTVALAQPCYRRVYPSLAREALKQTYCLTKYRSVSSLDYSKSLDKFKVTWNYGFYACLRSRQKAQRCDPLLGKLTLLRFET